MYLKILDACDIFWYYFLRIGHICVGNLAIIGSDNGLSPGWGQVTIWTNAGILLNEQTSVKF